MKVKLMIALFYIVGLLFLSLGISMMILADLGAGPWDAMYVGLSELFGLTVGSWVFIVGILVILINSLLLRKIPDFLAVITIFLIGSFIDFWLLAVFAGLPTIGIGMRIVILTGGMLIIAIGIACYLQSNFARNPVDNLMMALQSLTGKSLAFTKTVMEVLVFVIAFLIGGPIGIGTIIITLIIGPLIQLFYPTVTKFKNRICNEETSKG